MLLLITTIGLVAIVSSKRSGGKKLAVGALSASQLRESNAVRQTGLLEKNVALHVKHIQEQNQTNPSDSASGSDVSDANKRPTTHDGTHGDNPDWMAGGKYNDGRCCKTKKTIDGDKIYRWFYWQEENGTVKKNNGMFAKCPGKWESTDEVRCSQHRAEVYNQVGYVENTDWILCCKKGEKKDCPYFTGQECEKKTATFKCTSYSCTWKANVDAASQKCDSGYKMYINEDVKKHCKKTSEGLTPADCAGYMQDCAQAYCYIDSHTPHDCREKCDNFEKNAKEHPNTVKVGTTEEKSGSYKGAEGMPMMGWIGIGAFVLIAGGLGAYMMFASKKNPKGIPQDEVAAYNDEMRAKGYGKGKGKGHEQKGGPPQYPPYDYGGQPPNSGPAAYGQAAPAWGVVPMVPQSW